MSLIVADAIAGISGTIVGAIVVMVTVPWSVDGTGAPHALERMAPIMALVGRMKYILGDVLAELLSL